MSQQPADLYSLLGVSPGATTTEIEAAFATLRLKATTDGEPDGPDPDRLQYAYDVLSDPKRRALYDSLLSDSGPDHLVVEAVASTERLSVSSDPQLLYVLLTVRPPEQQAARPRRLNLGLAIDRSTSMRGARLEKVLAAVELIISKLGPDDILSLVTFSDRAEVVLPAATVASRTGPTQANLGQVESGAWRRQLRAVQASGGTEIFHGLNAGLSEVRRHATPDYTSHLILLTDGHTYGDVPECLRLAETAAAEGIGLSAFGIGSDWNDHFLDALVAPSGGQSGHIKEPGDIIGHLEERLKGLGDIHAQQVQLKQAWPSQVTLEDAFKLAPYAQPVAQKEDIIPLGNVEGRSPLVFLLEFRVAPQTIPSRITIPLTVSYRGGAGRDGHSANQTVQVMVVPGADPREIQPTPAVIEAVRRFNLYCMQEQAWDEAQSGQLETAAARMYQLTTRYLESGDMKLAQQAQLEAQRLTRIGKMSPEGRKMLRYGTRSLLGESEGV
jgi:Ca-activated chloride channel family protein